MPRKRLPQNHYPDHIEAQNERLYMFYIDKLVNRYSDRILKAYKAELETDAEDLNDLSVSMMQYAGALSLVEIEKLTQQVANSINLWNFENAQKALDKISQTRRIPVVNAKKIVPEIQANMKLWAKTNASLIKQIVMEEADVISDAMLLEVRKDVAAIVEGAVTEGQALRTISKRIKEATGVTTNKAKFWARDQTAKLNRDVNKTRIQNAGMPGYVWITSEDGRVRPSHAAKHGQYFVWGETDIDPGDEENCRCYASPVFGPQDQLSQTQIDSDLRFIRNDRELAIIEHKQNTAMKFRNRANRGFVKQRPTPEGKRKRPKKINGKTKDSRIATWDKKIKAFDRQIATKKRVLANNS